MDQSVALKHRHRSIIEGLKAILIIWILLGVIWLVIPFSREVLLALSLCLAGSILWFFRDADPVAVGHQGLVISPAHGKIDYIDQTFEKSFLKGPAHRISIYLSLLNVHVQYAPTTAKVELLNYSPGSLWPAKNRESSSRNQHLFLGLGGENAIALRLISGPFVRRIVPWIQTGQSIAGGERIGLIRFGSRVDIYLPLSAKILVKVGEPVVGGCTPIAKLTR